MKLNLKVLLSISLLVALVSCVDTGVEGEIFLGGKIDNGTDSVIYLYKEPSAVSSFLGQSRTPADTLITNEKGLFLSGAEYDSGMYAFEYQNVEIPLFLLPQKKLNVNLNINRPAKSLEFSGSLKHMNRLIRDQNSKMVAMEHEAERRKDEPGKAFLQFLDSARRSLDTTTVRFITNHPRTDKRFMEYRQKYTFYKTGNLLLDYVFYKQSQSEVDTISNELQNALSSFPVNRDESIHNPQYLNFAYRYTALAGQNKLKKENSVLADSIILSVIDSVITAPQTKSAVALRYAMEMMDQKGSVPDKERLKQINALVSSREFRRILDAELEAYGALNPGVSAPSFTAVDGEEKERNISDFRGRPVLIYVGVSACGHCRNDFLKLKELTDKYEDLALIGIGTGIKFRQWKTYITRYDLPGTQLFIEESNPFTDRYRIRSLPRYILLDEEGKMVHAKTDNPADEVKQLFESNELSRVQANRGNN